MSREIFGLNLGGYERSILISGLILWSAAIASLYASSQTSQEHERDQQAALIARGLQAANQYKQQLAISQKKQAQQAAYRYENACGVSTNLYANTSNQQMQNANAQ